VRKHKDFNQLTPAYFTDQNLDVITTPVLKGIPENKSIALSKNTMHYRSFDFSDFYGYGYDDITSAFQQTAEIMLSESIIEVTTVLSSCKKFKSFAKYLGIFSKALQRDLFLSDINFDLIEKYIKSLKIKYPNGTTAKGSYSELKSVLIKMQRIGWLDRFEFPTNPFPNSNRIKKGHKAFSKAERKRLAYSLKDDAQKIIKKNESLNSYDLTILLLSIAFRSGMNTTPLLEMTTDSIKNHPLKDNRKLLVLYKRRGKSGYQMQNIRSTEIVESVQTVFPDVAVMIQCIIELNQSMRAEINSDLVFLYRTERRGKVSSISPATLMKITHLWVRNKGLKNDDGEPLRVNISRLRKTFTNRIWELSGGDPFVTAALANHKVKVSQTHYLEAPKEAERDFKYMGEVRVEELTTPINMIANNTPLSKCSDIPNRYDNSGNEIYCTNFLSCVRCRNMVVAKEDLYRLFSFYWLIVYEREQIGARRWDKYFAHIIRIIDRDIAPKFEVEYVRTIKEKAKSNPHPAWKHRNQLEELNE
jgi:integrase